MRAKLGHMESRLQVYSLAEVFQRNATGACWLILDGARQAVQDPGTLPYRARCYRTLQ